MRDGNKPGIVRAPDAPGWWARIGNYLGKTRGDVRLYRVRAIQGMSDETLCVWYGEFSDGFVPVIQLCRPSVRWYGPIDIPAEDE